eukprot:ctg_1230.g444
MSSPLHENTRQGSTERGHPSPHGWFFLPLAAQPQNRACVAVRDSAIAQNPRRRPQLVASAAPATCDRPVHRAPDAPQPTVSRSASRSIRGAFRRSDVGYATWCGVYAAVVWASSGRLSLSLAYIRGVCLPSRPPTLINSFVIYHGEWSLSYSARFVAQHVGVGGQRGVRGCAGFHRTGGCRGGHHACRRQQPVDFAGFRHHAGFQRPREHAAGRRVQFRFQLQYRGRGRGEQLVRLVPSGDRRTEQPAVLDRTIERRRDAGEVRAAGVARTRQLHRIRLRHQRQRLHVYVVRQRLAGARSGADAARRRVRDPARLAARAVGLVQLQWQSAHLRGHLHQSRRISTSPAASTAVSSGRPPAAVSSSTARAPAAEREGNESRGERREGGRGRRRRIFRRDRTLKRNSGESVKVSDACGCRFQRALDAPALVSPMESTETFYWSDGRAPIEDLDEVSTVRVYGMASAMLGLQYCWAVQNGWATSVLLELGLSKRWVAAAWLAGPLAGW